MLVTEEEFLNWKEDIVTKEFFSKISSKREQIKEDLVHQLYENPDFACGKAMAFLDLLEMKYADLVEKEIKYE